MFPRGCGTGRAVGRTVSGTPLAQAILYRDYHPPTRIIHYGSTIKLLYISPGYAGWVLQERAKEMVASCHPPREIDIGMCGKNERRKRPLVYVLLPAKVTIAPLVDRLMAGATAIFASR